MKRIYFSLVLVLFFGVASAQTNVHLKINHMLGASPFLFSVTATNNNSVEFNVERMEYYVDQITLVHDGGMQTLVPNTWLLVDAGTAVNEMLGNFAITSLEEIRFGIGVDSAYNHLDPSTYASSHPLAPQLPSMHWGWSSGYRFVAMEGKTGANFGTTYQIHALEDYNYHTVVVPATGTMVGSDLTIELDADYEMALRDIDVSPGVFNHGGTGEAATLLTNFRDHVFSETTLSTEVDETLENEDFNLTMFPNPVQTNQLVTLQGEFPQGAMLEITDLSGRVLQQMEMGATGVETAIDAPGYYLAAIVHKGQRIGVKKMVVIE
jgi:hypothetical protein